MQIIEADYHNYMTYPIILPPGIQTVQTYERKRQMAFYGCLKKELLSFERGLYLVWWAT